MALDKTLDAGETAVGDLIRAHILNSAGDIPRDARVYGRVSRVINFDGQIPLPKPEHPPPEPLDMTRRWHAGEVLIQIEFLQIEYRHSPCRSSPG